MRSYNNSHIKARRWKDVIFRWIITILSFIPLIPLFLIIVYVIVNGIRVISFKFLFSLPKTPMFFEDDGGGILNAIVGTLIVVTTASIMAVPVGIIVGIYIAERPKSILTRIVRIFMEITQSTPSIIFGIVMYIWLVRSMGGFSALAGSIALATMMLPMIIKTTEEIIKLIPGYLKEASLALGTPYYRTILKLILPTGFSRIFTGVLVAISRIAGETAPLLFTAFGNPFLVWSLLKPMETLPLLIYKYATSPYKAWWDNAWGASLVLITIILLINIISKWVEKRWKVEF